MINKNIVSSFHLAFLAFFSFGILISCNENKNKVDTGKITINARFMRFDNDLFDLQRPVSQAGINNMRKKYPSFFDLFCNKIIHIPAENDSILAVNLDLFITDQDVRAIRKKTTEIFAETNNLQEEVIELLKYYHHYFPAKPVPDIVTYISAFNYTIITADSVLGVGLDMYLGKDCEFYPALGLPKYMVDKLSREYMMRDVAKALFQSEYDPDQVSSEFLSQLIYQGKLLYYTDLLLPGANDTLKIGYSKNQLNWCMQNERNIWGFMIENNLLYEKDAARYIRYINDGNSTQGLPKEAPAKLGAWVGWNIVKAYMKKHPEMKVEKLLSETDAQKILTESGYKPAK